MKKTISVLTATRAEYGLLKPLVEKLNRTKEYEVRIVVTGMHLSPEYGLTYKEIERDGFIIDKKIDILQNCDTSVGISASMGTALKGFSEYFEALKPDLLIVLGDRYETLAVCIAAMNSRIPIAHLHGGETTEGAIDEAIRHSITKMSYLHFTSTEEYRRRVIQLGEHPDRVFNVGAIGIESIKNLSYMDWEEFKASINFDLNKRFALLTFHPVTLEAGTEEEQFSNILQVMDEFEQIQLIITGANADSGGSKINRMIGDYVASRRGRCVAFTSLGQRRYLSALKYCSFVIGNSSSGIIEAPSFHKPTINIGDRQKGRTQAESVIQSEPVKENIRAAIEKALSAEFLEHIKDTKNPYGDGNVTDKILPVIQEFFQNNRSVKKKFYDL